MVALTWLSAATTLVLSAWPHAAIANPGFRWSPGTSYRSGNSVCPERCDNSGPNTGNWSVYPNFKQIRECQETMFYDFSLFDNVDDGHRTHRIQACSSYGLDFASFPASTARIAFVESVVEFELGWWERGYGLADAGLRSIVKQLRHYTEGGHGSRDGPFIIYGQSGQATIGLYVGQGLLSQGLGESALRLFHDNLDNLEVSTPSLAMQLCEKGYDNTHIFGIMATSNGVFAPIQSAIKSWANATCLSFSGSTKLAGSAKFTTPLLNGNHPTLNSTLLADNLARNRLLRAGAECTTVQVDAGNSCADFSVKCGISGADFTKYNPGVNFCSTLKPKQHVCCSKGALPDVRPKPNEDGSCKAYQVQANDSCASLAAEYSLEMDDFEDFNRKTWGWNGCKLLFKDTIMCLSEGTPPFPAVIPNAQCGPQKPGTTPPTDGSDIADLNPCPSNACCNIWGQCGITSDFCIDTNTGAPGTAEPGSYGCISNCGMRGTSDWSSDQQEENDPPAPAENWGGLQRSIFRREDSKTDDSRNGNWTDFDCTHPAIANYLDYTPSDRWKLLGADAAWADIVRIWKDIDSKKKGVSFIQSVRNTTYSEVQQKCGQMKGLCSTVSCDKGADGELSGPAAQFIWNSLAEIHYIYETYYDTLLRDLTIVNTTLKNMEKKFAPLPPEKDDTWLLTLIDIVTLGALGSAGPYFNTMLKKHDWFAGKTGSALDYAKNSTMTLMGQSMTIAKDALPGSVKTSWTPEVEDEFSAYLGQVVLGWTNVTSLALQRLFSGTTEAIDAIGNAMSDGKLINGKMKGTAHESQNAQNDLLSNIKKCIVGFTLPILWRQSGTYTFIIDAGHACDEKKDLSEYLTPETMEATGVCVDGWQYYLANPDGDSEKCNCFVTTGSPDCTQVCINNKFSAPIGIENISKGNSYLGITKDDLVKGSVNTWVKNGRWNGAKVADPTNQDTISDLMDVDITTPGFMRIPVCSPERAFQSWGTTKKGTTDTSPNVEGCLQIVRNIEGDAQIDWTTDVIAHKHRVITKVGTCRFGIEATKTDGIVNFVVGGQGVIDTINDSIEQFAKNGQIGAMGTMRCNGNVKSQPVEWNIY